MGAGAGAGGGEGRPGPGRMLGVRSPGGASRARGRLVLFVVRAAVRRCRPGSSEDCRRWRIVVYVCLYTVQAVFHSFATPLLANAFIVFGIRSEPYRGKPFTSERNPWKSTPSVVGYGEVVCLESAATAAISVELRDGVAYNGAPMALSPYTANRVAHACGFVLLLCLCAIPKLPLMTAPKRKKRKRGTGKREAFPPRCTAKRNKRIKRQETRIKRNKVMSNTLHRFPPNAYGPDPEPNRTEHQSMTRVWPCI